MALNFSALQFNGVEPVYVQIAQYVKRQIVLKQTFSGDQLPTRRELAAQLKVNPNTVQKAFKMMEEQGYVRTSGRLGSRVYIDEHVMAQIEREMTVHMVQDFIQSAKQINLSFKQVVDLISDLWEQET